MRYHTVSTVPNTPTTMQRASAGVSGTESVCFLFGCILLYMFTESAPWPTLSECEPCAVFLESEAQFSEGKIVRMTGYAKILHLCLTAYLQGSVQTHTLPHQPQV